MKNTPLLLLAFALLAPTLDAANFTVTNNAASGAGSLAQALTSAGSQAGADTITFDAALSGQTITPTSVLVIDQDVTIDATGLAVAPTLSGGGVRQLVSVFTNRTVAIKGAEFHGGRGRRRGSVVQWRHADAGALHLLGEYRSGPVRRRDLQQWHDHDSGLRVLQ